MSDQLGRAVGIQPIMNYTAAGTGDTLTSSTIDLQGFDGCLIICKLGAITATGVPTLTAQDSDDDSTYDAITGASVVGDAADDNLCMVLDIRKGPSRYVQGVLTRATANIVVDCMIAIKYNADKKPVTQEATHVVNAAIDFVVGQT